MKITLSPSKDQQFETHAYNTVSLESPHDTIVVEDAMRLVTSALVAWGYAPESVAEYLDEEFANDHLGINSHSWSDFADNFSTPSTIPRELTEEEVKNYVESSEVEFIESIHDTLDD